MGEEMLAERFEAQRGHLRAVAYRMLGSVSEAEDAVQEAWLRLSRSDSSEVANLGGWLTTVVGRVCLDMLRSRRTRREEPLGLVYDAAGGDAPHAAAGPEQEAVLADSVGMALLVVLQTLEPAERLAFVLHDMFAVPFDEIAPIVDRTPAATRQLASRARRRVQGAPAVPEPDLPRQRRVVGAFLDAARRGDFEALLAVLDPDVVTSTDSALLAGRRGAAEVARNALVFAAMAKHAVLAMVDGRVGVLSSPGTPDHRVLTFEITADDRVSAFTVLTDPETLARMTVTPLD